MADTELGKSIETLGERMDNFVETYESLKEVNDDLAEAFP
jgi:hypothetical protein